MLRVTDEVVSGTPSDYHDVQSQPENNYAYDGIGNLVRDTRENITGISWSVYGKILQVTKTVNSQTQTIGYSYDAAGNRISKQVNGATTYYVRDAGGNTMAVYTMGDNSVNNGAVTLQEQHLYGSSRLGIQKPGLEVSSLLPAYSTQVGTTTKSIYSIFERGKKFFELSNHLGNVLATVSDKKYLLAANSTGNGGCAPGSAAEDVLVSLRGTETVYTGRSSVSLLPGFESSGGDNFEVYADAGLSACNPATDNSMATSTVYAAEVVSAQDYAPFGMELVGRQYNASSYRYGFNGKEKSNEIYGEGNAYDFGERIQDPRLGGRWFSVDPMASKMPGWSPYSFAFNSPISHADYKGLYPILTVTNQITGYTAIKVYGKTGNPTLIVPTYKAILKDVTNGKTIILGTFNVTRDGYYNIGSKKNEIKLEDRSFEPKKEVKYTAVKFDYVEGTPALALRQNGSTKLDAIPLSNHTYTDGTPIPKDIDRKEPGTATGVMIHIGGAYEHQDGTVSLGGTYGCMGVVSPTNVYNTKAAAQQAVNDKSYMDNTSNATMTDLSKKMDESNAKDPSPNKIEVIVKKRKN